MTNWHALLLAWVVVILATVAFVLSIRAEPRAKRKEEE